MGLRVLGLGLMGLKVWGFVPFSRALCRLHEVAALGISPRKRNCNLNLKALGTANGPAFKSLFLVLFFVHESWGISIQAPGWVRISMLRVYLRLRALLGSKIQQAYNLYNLQVNFSFQETSVTVCGNTAANPSNLKL